MRRFSKPGWITLQPVSGASGADVSEGTGVNVGATVAVGVGVGGSDGTQPSANQSATIIMANGQRMGFDVDVNLNFVSPNPVTAK